MTIAELIELLQTKPQDIEVVYRRHSEHCLMEPTEVVVEELGEARPDGWVHDKRPDKASRNYLVFPGN